MIEDKIIQEIRKTRNEIAKSFNYDTKAISSFFLNQAKKMEAKGVKFVAPRKKATSKKAL